MTEKLYYQDSHRKTFSAQVLMCEQVKDGYQVVLDRTAFFPEGGGQSADSGILDGQRVLDVREKQDIISHLVKKPIETGKNVSGVIDFEERFFKMQQHTGEHIVSGIVHARFGYENVGFHLGDKLCTMDFSGPITKMELSRIEWEANRAVFQNLDVQVTYPDKEQLQAMEYRSKIEIDGQVRIVTIEGYDVCACCAPHVKKTGEIGLIKLIGMQNYKGGVRVTMVCGFRALQDYCQKEESVKAISYALSAREDVISDAVCRVKEEVMTLKSSLANLQKEVLHYKAEELKADRVVCLFEQGLDGNAPRELVNLILKKEVEICAVFTGNSTEGYRYVIGSKTYDVRTISKRLGDVFEGRGGGKPEMVQGTVIGNDELIRKLILECSCD